MQLRHIPCRFASARYFADFDFMENDLLRLHPTPEQRIIF